MTSEKFEKGGAMREAVICIQRSRKGVKEVVKKKKRKQGQCMHLRCHTPLPLKKSGNTALATDLSGRGVLIASEGKDARTNI